jgi:hypothetical protein
MRRGISILLLVSLLSLVLFAQKNEKKLDPCALLTAADAASIAGAPMPLVDRSKSGCTYGVLGKRTVSGVGSGREVLRDVSLSIKTYKNAQARDKEWTKTVGAPVNKDSIVVPNEIGDEAILPARTKDGKPIESLTVVNVRKGLVVFSLMIWDTTQASSADAAIAVAKKIADQL